MLCVTDLFEIKIKDILTGIKLLLQKKSTNKSLLFSYVSESLLHVTIIDYQKVRPWLELLNIK